MTEVDEMADVVVVTIVDGTVGLGVVGVTTRAVVNVVISEIGVAANEVGDSRIPLRGTTCGFAVPQP